MRNEVLISTLSKAEQDKAYLYRLNRSGLGERHKGLSLDSVTVTDDNKAVVELLKKYRDNAKAMYDDGVGLYLHGQNGVGKTYLLACLCNDLLRDWNSCYFTNVIRLTDGIFNDSDAVFEKVEKAEFLFIDDLGKELLGREFDRAKCTWQEQKLFEVLDMRYNSGKPVIFSSNYSIMQLVTTLKIDTAISDRIMGLSSKVIELKGGSWRRKEQEKKAVDLLG